MFTAVQSNLTNKKNWRESKQDGEKQRGQRCKRGKKHLNNRRQKKTLFRIKKYSNLKTILNTLQMEFIQKITQIHLLISMLLFVGGSRWLTCSERDCKFKNQ